MDPTGSGSSTPLSCRPWKFILHYFLSIFFVDITQCSHFRWRTRRFSHVGETRCLSTSGCLKFSDKKDNISTNTEEGLIGSSSKDKGYDSTNNNSSNSGSSSKRNNIPPNMTEEEEESYALVTEKFFSTQDRNKESFQAGIRGIPGYLFQGDSRVFFLGSLDTFSWGIPGYFFQWK